jgi:hypothetical protein
MFNLVRDRFPDITDYLRLLIYKKPRSKTIERGSCEEAHALGVDCVSQIAPDGRNWAANAP